jgi:hypothetical protein
MTDLLGAFTVRQSGNIGQEILDQDGNTIAWTTDAWLAQVVCKLLTENMGLLGRKQETDESWISSGQSFPGRRGATTTSSSGPRSS